jgi:hypothetical protein
MDEPSEETPDEAESAVPPDATDEDVESAISDVERTATRGPAPGADGGEDSPTAGESVDTPASEEPSDAADEAELPEELREGDLAAPASAEEGGHTLLEEYEREQEPSWRSRLRQGAFWVAAIAVAVGLTLGGVVSLTESGFSDGAAFIIASVGMAVMVGFVFLSLQT